VSAQTAGHLVSVAIFSGLIVWVVALDQRARRDDSTLTSFGHVMGRLMATRTGRVGVLLAWWWMGWHLLAR
jgi:Family of unknown function (DUF6186)